MANVIAWFEIPVKDMDRAVAFYSTLLGRKIEKGEVGGMPYTFFSNDMDGVGGALAQHENYKPSDQGTVVYLASRDLAEPLSRVEGAGGRVVMPKTLIGEGLGYSAQFLDTEGNRVGLFSMD